MCSILELDLDPRAQRVRDLWGSRHKLRIQFTFPHDSSIRDCVRGEIHLAQGPLSVTFGFTCYGWDLAEFASRLEALHATLDGEAEFVSQDGCARIGLSVADRGLGSIAVHVRLEHFPVSAITEDWEQRILEFEGFATDQSYLPGLVTQIRGFLNDNDIPTGYPMQ